MESGPDGSSSHRGTFFQSPGVPSGTKEQRLKQPALPNEQCSPGGTGSITVTSCPRSLSAAAQARPTTPAPITLTRTSVEHRVRGLRDLLPLRVLAHQEHGELVGCVAHDVEVQVGEALAHIRHLHDLAHL